MDLVYIETSIISYVTARPSRDVLALARQRQANDWWSLQRPKYRLVTSQLTLDEAAAGDPIAAGERLLLLEGLPLVEINLETEALARRLLDRQMLPARAIADALHVAAAALGGVNYLLTLNCKHIANAKTLPKIYEFLFSEGFGPLLICTPAEFLGDGDDVDTTNNY